MTEDLQGKFEVVSASAENPISFQRDKQLSANQTHIQSPGMLAFMGLFYMWLVHWNARMTEMKRSGIEVSSCVRR